MIELLYDIFLKVQFSCIIFRLNHTSLFLTFKKPDCTENFKMITHICTI